MPDLYYDGAPTTGPDQVASIHVLEQLGHQAGKPTVMWEMFAGSGMLSTCAYDCGVSHLPPVDFRWGYHLGRLHDQLSKWQAARKAGACCGP